MSPPAIVRLPTPLRPFAGGAGEVAAKGATVGEVLRHLGSAHEGLLERVLDEQGALRPFVNVYLGKHNVKVLQGLDTPVREGEVLSILPAVAGGAAARVGTAEESEAADGSEATRESGAADERGAQP